MKQLRVLMITVLLIFTMSFGFAEIQEVEATIDDYLTLEQELAIDYNRLTVEQLASLNVLYDEIAKFEMTDNPSDEETFSAMLDEFYDLLRSYNIEGPVASYNDYLDVLKPRLKDSDIARIYELVEQYDIASKEYYEALETTTEEINKAALDEIYSEVFYIFEDNNIDFDELENHVTSGNMNYGLFDIVNGKIKLSEKSITKAEDISKERMALYEESWNTAKLLITDKYIKWFVLFELNTDGYQEDMAFVQPENDDNSVWRLGLDLRDTFLSDGSYHEEFYLTLVHELFHAMSLNNEQLMVDAPIVPTTYVDDYGTFKEDSYVNQFYSKFWIAIKDDYDSFDDYTDYYYANEEDFITEYSATNPVEDIAESFSYFVTCDKTTGNTIAEQKINFFYQYPELVEYRSVVQEIIKNQQ